LFDPEDSVIGLPLENQEAFPAMAAKKKSAVLRKTRPGRPSPAPAGARCGLCGKTKNLTKTECCGNWICDDEENYVMFSYARNSCSRNHRRYTLCASHHTEGHSGDWKDCPKCRKGIETEMYVWYGTNEYNFEKLPNPPDYKPTKCSDCGKVIVLGEEGYSVQGKKYWCERCSARRMREDR
jgi:hypothetical protein